MLLKILKEGVFLRKKKDSTFERDPDEQAEIKKLPANVESLKRVRGES